ncbi:MAG TPA: periplasmic heavy metal sensor [Usitatibacter sp.]|nr:periplasmic heavy metal sensor [Usitatibacter sp.]
MKLRHAIAFLALGAAVAQAQPPGAGHSPYAGQQSRDIKALSEDEVKGLLAGAGLGYARPAELNRYPGPMHALEHAEALQLTSAQRERMQALMKSHKAEARELGARLVALERELDQLFANRKATAESVDRVLLQIGEATARVRGSHLKTHLEATAILTPAQVDRYVELRGYGGGAHHGHRH